MSVMSAGVEVTECCMLGTTGISAQQLTRAVYESGNYISACLSGPHWNALLLPGTRASISCRRWTRATRCITRLVLYTNVNGACDKLASTVASIVNGRQFITLSVHLYRTKLTTLCDVGCAVAKISKSIVLGTKLQYPYVPYVTDATACYHPHVPLPFIIIALPEN